MPSLNRIERGRNQVKIPTITGVGGPGTTPTLTPAKQVKNVPNFHNMARLQTIGTIERYGLTQQNQVASQVTIYIPHLPESIRLPRENSYETSGSNMVMPDGYFVYQYTNPLEIPIEFTLHAWDDLCDEGSNSLLTIGALLHSLTLPTTNEALNNKKVPPSTDNTNKGSSSESLLTRSETGFAATKDTINEVFLKDQNFRFPPACELLLIQAGHNGLGIRCAGFVKSATVELHGPYLNGGNDVYNLPSAATYSFVFVHNPSYTNKINKNSTIKNAYGPDVLNYFYNTLHLKDQSLNSYSDIQELDNTRKPQ